MRFVYQAGLFSVLLVSSLARGQEPTKPTSQSGPPPLELKVTKLPLWKDNCLTLSVQQANLSNAPIFLDAMYEGIKIYSSVSDAANTLGQGPGEAWMLIYGWTDVISEPIELGPRARRQSTLCIAETFPVKETGKEALRQVPVQGKLRIVAGYEIPTWRIIDQSQGKGRRAYVRIAENSTRWTFGEVVLEIPIPCPNGVSSSDSLSPPQIFPGEHDVHTFELEPPAIEFQPPPPPNLPIDDPLPPKPPQLMMNVFIAEVGTGPNFSDFPTNQALTSSDDNPFQRNFSWSSRVHLRSPSIHDVQCPTESTVTTPSVT